MHVTTPRDTTRGGADASRAARDHTGGCEWGRVGVKGAAEGVTGAGDQTANGSFGAVIDDSLGDEVRVTVRATGFGGQRRRRRRELSEAPIPAASGLSCQLSFASISTPLPSTRESDGSLSGSEIFCAARLGPSARTSTVCEPSPKTMRPPIMTLSPVCTLPRVEMLRILEPGPLSRA